MAIKWKPAGAVFQGGTKELLALKGRQVRSRNKRLQVCVYVPQETEARALDVELGSMGLLANPLGANVLIAIPRVQGGKLTTLDAITRSGAFDVISINWPTFQMQFDIEA